MAQRKKKRIRIEKEARRTARAVLGSPPAERTIPDKRRKALKRKPTLGELLTD